METQMTYRERLEARAARREEWAASRARKYEQANNTARELSKRFEWGQPILVGHHSEKSARNAQARMWNATERAHEHANKASEHAYKADGINRQLERSIFSDDPDAIDALVIRIAELEAKRDAMKIENDAFRKAHKAELKSMTAYQKDQVLPHASFTLTNLSANIRRNKERLSDLQRVATDDRPLKVMQARRDGECERCSGAIASGEWIGKYSDGWLHVKGDESTPNGAWIPACE
jgi:hypothetical protein